MRCRELIEILEALAPLSMACEWDNPGLLAGRSDKEVRTVFLAVDATESVVDDAINCGADLIITHHPLIFKPLKKVNDEDFISRRILKMIRSDISCYAMHTNFDAAPGCMGHLAGERMRLRDTRVLEVMGRTADDREYGIGIFGAMERPMTLRETAEAVKAAYGLPFVTVFKNPGDTESEGQENRSNREAGRPGRIYRTAAICPGSGGSTLQEALRRGADVYITGDIGHHQGIDAVANGMAVIDAGHYGIEHIFTEFMEQFLREMLGGELTTIKEKNIFPNCVV